tara:strand:+ start:2888 stop:3265 length:378 start_codon:yes stop_codon:yes gene_type:complete
MADTAKPNHPIFLHLGSKIYTIQVQSLEEEGCYGCVDLVTKEIFLDPNQSDQDYKFTLLHEILHVAYDFLGLGDDEEMIQIKNEFIVTATTNILQLLQFTNPELFSFIFSSDSVKKSRDSQNPST